MTSEQQAMVEQNTALIAFVLQNKLHRTHGEPEWDDMYQDGAFGLMMAVKGFKPELGYKFSTYAARYIWGYILNGHRDRHKTRGPQLQMLSLDYEYAHLNEDGEGTLLDGLADPLAEFEDAVATRDMARRVMRELQKEPLQAEAVLMKVAFDGTNARAARIAGCGPETLRRRRRAAITRVRSALAEEAV